MIHQQNKSKMAAQIQNGRQKNSFSLENDETFA